MKYGIAYTNNGAPPPTGKIVSWKQKSNQDWICDDPYYALEILDLDGWTGYVCSYPSGEILTSS